MPKDQLSSEQISAERGFYKGLILGQVRPNYNDYHDFKSEVEKQLKDLKEEWKPTCGYESEEEKGFQKGIIAQMKLTNKKIDELLQKLSEVER